MVVEEISGVAKIVPGRRAFHPNDEGGRVEGGASTSFVLKAS